MTVKEVLNKAKAGMTDLAKKLDLKKTPQNVAELRVHEKAKANKHTSGQFTLYLESTTDKLPVLLVSSAPNVKIDPNYDSLAAGDKTKGWAFGTWMVDANAKFARFTPDSGSKGLSTSNKTQADLLPEAISFCTDWDTKGIRTLWANIPQPLGEKPIAVAFSVFHVVAEDVLGEFARYAIANTQADALFWCAVALYMKAPDRAKAIAIHDNFCTQGATAVEVNCGPVIKPGSPYEKAMSALKNNTSAKPNGKEFDLVIAATGTVVPVLANFVPKLPLAEHIDCQGQGKRLDVKSSMMLGFAKNDWEPVRLKLKQAGLKVDTWKL